MVETVIFKKLPAWVILVVRWCIFTCDSVGTLKCSSLKSQMFRQTITCVVARVQFLTAVISAISTLFVSVFLCSDCF